MARHVCRSTVVWALISHCAIHDYSNPSCLGILWHIRCFIHAKESDAYIRILLHTYTNTDIVNTVPMPISYWYGLILSACRLTKVFYYGILICDLICENGSCTHIQFFNF